MCSCFKTLPNVDKRPQAQQKTQVKTFSKTCFTKRNLVGVFHNLVKGLKRHSSFPTIQSQKCESFREKSQEQNHVVKGDLGGERETSPAAELSPSSLNSKFRYQSGSKTSPFDSKLAPDWAWLPDEVLRLVFGHLEGSCWSCGIPRSRCRGAASARAACHNWRRVVTQELSALCPSGRGGALPRDWARLFPRLEAVDLSRCHNAGDSRVASLAQLPRLSSLRVTGSEGVTALGVAALRRFSGTLRQLDLTDCRRVGDGAAGELSCLTQLTSLVLDGCRSMTDAGAAKLAGMPQLKRLSAARCPKLTDAAAASLSMQGSLTSLSFAGCRGITDGGLQHVGGLPRLTELDVGGCGAEGKAAGRLPEGLAALRMGGCEGLGDERLHDLRCAGQLGVLDISGSAVTDLGLRLIGDHFLRLQDLNVARCRGITDGGFRHLVGLQLRCLGLSFCAVSDAGISVLAAAQPNLCELSLRGCGSVTDEGLEALARGATRLMSLDLGSCGSVTEAGLASLAGLSSLISLSLQYCDSLSDSAIAALVEALPGLAHLNTDRTSDNNLIRNTGSRISLL
uniref:F-box and leucine-rich repeat protein 7 n=2 Tax=Tetraselmis sp. GSL018 TaxID=582737 RepID=A0A061R0D9_9CHLO